MLRFRQIKTLQKSASVNANIHDHFFLERYPVDRQTSEERRSAALAELADHRELSRCARSPSSHRVETGLLQTDGTPPQADGTS